MKTATLLLAILACAAAPAQAKFVTTQQLVEALDSGECTKNNFAHGYIIGVYDSFEGTLYAQHPALDEGTLVRIVADYLRKVSSDKVFSAQVLIMRALEEHFKAKEGEFTVKP